MKHITTCQETSKDEIPLSDNFHAFEMGMQERQLDAVRWKEMRFSLTYYFSRRGEAY